MAETWRVTRLKVAVFRVIDAIGRPFSAFFGSKRRASDDVRSILVMEPWHIGDVVLATPALRALRKRYPGARIALLGKQHAEELLRHSGLVDEVIVFDLPWTAKTSKYNPRRYHLKSLRALVSSLKSRNFDLTVDARMDLRSNIVTWLTRAPRRIGFDYGGGSFLLTDAVPAQPSAKHRVEDWLDLMGPLGADSETFEPLLEVGVQEREWAGARLSEAGIGDDDIVVAFHGGASDPRRMWPFESLERIAQQLVEHAAVKTVFFIEPDAPDRPIAAATLAAKTTLREMMALLSRCNLCICNDSGPMHIADALGVPVVAIFLTGNPVWHRPYREGQAVVGEGTGHDFRVRPTEEEIIRAAMQRLSALPESR